MPSHSGAHLHAKPAVSTNVQLHQTLVHSLSPKATSPIHNHLPRTPPPTLDLPKLPALDLAPKATYPVMEANTLALNTSQREETFSTAATSPALSPLPLERTTSRTEVNLTRIEACVPELTYTDNAGRIIPESPVEMRSKHYFATEYTMDRKESLTKDSTAEEVKNVMSRMEEADGKREERLDLRLERLALLGDVRSLNVRIAELEERKADVESTAAGRIERLQRLIGEAKLELLVALDNVDTLKVKIESLGASGQ